MKKRLSRFWNGSIGGTIGAMISFVKSSIFRVSDKFSSFLWTSNLERSGSKVFIQRGVVIRYPGNISLGKNVSIGRYVSLTSEFGDSKLVIGDNSQINLKCDIDFSGGLLVQSNVVISEGTKIYTHSHGYDPRSSPVKKRLLICDNVWIGTNCLILENVNFIGENSIVAAGSVVTKDVPSNVIVGGNPAKVIKHISRV
jgi:acetyltransferase-like isoleucine patch superfamily enzyme